MSVQQEAMADDEFSRRAALVAAELLCYQPVRAVHLTRVPLARQSMLVNSPYRLLGIVDNALAVRSLARLGEPLVDGDGDILDGNCSSSLSCALLGVDIGGFFDRLDERLASLDKPDSLSVEDFDIVLLPANWPDRIATLTAIRRPQSDGSQLRLYAPEEWIVAAAIYTVFDPHTKTFVSPR